MKILFFSLGLLAIISLVAGLLIALAPTIIETRSSITIHAPKAEVFKKISHLSQYPNWSPWLDTDPNQKHYITGSDGQVGSKFHWQSVAEKGAGFQEIVSLKDNNEVHISCHILEPFKSEPTFRYTVSEESPASTTVSLHFVTKAARPFNAVFQVIQLAKGIQKNNDRALAKLKSYAENEFHASAVKANLQGLQTASR